MKVYNLLLSLLALNIIYAPVILQADECTKYTKKITQESLEATASFWSNLRQHKGSVVYETSRLFHDAKEKINQFDRDANTCDLDKEASGKIKTKSCKLAQFPKMTFISNPKKFLTEYEDSEKCEKLLVETKKKPIVFIKRLPSDINPLLDWIGDFSQGSGKEGKELYDRCDGMCSPQYSYEITPIGEELEVVASVVCGHARDKEDNLYNLTYELTWPCENK